MTRPKHNQETIKKLLEVLIKYPDGIWLSKLAKEAGVPISTTAYYLSHQMLHLVEERSLGEERQIIRVIALKPRVIDAIQEGKSIAKIMKLMKILGEAA